MQDASSISLFKVNAVQNALCFIACNPMVFKNISRTVLAITVILQVAAMHALSFMLLYITATKEKSLHATEHSRDNAITT